MKTIILPHQRRALVDEDDFPFINKFKWSTQRTSHCEYAVRSEWIAGGKGKQKKIYMHRLIMNAGPGLEVDHISGNGLDNRKVNLRLSNRRENMRNQRKRRGTLSIYKGVTYCGGSRPWKAQICKDYKTIQIGLFATELNAAKAYDAAAIELFGSFARINDYIEVLS